MDELRIGYHCPSSQRALHELLNAGWTGVIIIDCSRTWLTDNKRPELFVDRQPKGAEGSVTRLRNSYFGEAIIRAYAASLRIRA